MDRAKVIPKTRLVGRTYVWDLWVETPIDDDWTAAFRLFPDAAGRPVVGELRIFPSAGRPDGPKAGTWAAEAKGIHARDRVPAGGLTSRKMRETPFEACHGQLTAIVATLEKKLGARMWGPGSPWSQAGLQPTTSPGRRRGRPGHSDEYLARVASVYVKHASKREAMRCTGDELDKGTEQARELVKLARRRGLLTPGIRGRAGGQLTQHARQLLGLPGPASADTKTSKKERS